MSAIKHRFSGQVAGTKTAVAGGLEGQVRLRLLMVLNTTAAVAYLQVFAKDSADVTVGTTAPDLSIGIPASASLVVPLPAEGLNLGGQGLTLAGTTTRTGATGAALDVNVGWGQ